MKEIIIHIGIPKTGTTYIQHLLRQNIKNLLSSGITYPDIESEHVEISYKEVSWEPSKNGILLLDEDYINNITSEKSLYSDESLLRLLLEDTKRIKMMKLLKKKGIRIKFIAFVRDFFEHSFSSWNQYIKRGIGSLEYLEYMNREDIYMDFKRLDKLIELSKTEKFSLEIYKYDKHKQDLFTFFLSKGLKIKEIQMFYTENKIVNRSLSRSESEIIRLLNKEFGKSISNNLVKELMNIELTSHKIDIPFIENEDYQRIVDKYSKTINRINAHKHLEEKIFFTSYEKLIDSSKNSQSSEYYFSREQLEKISFGLGKIFRKSNRLRDSDADYLRDIALQITLGKNKQKLGLKDSYKLMSLAKKARPDGPQITNWLKNNRKNKI